MGMATVAHRLALFLVLVCGLASTPSSAAQVEKLDIAVTVQPQAWLVERLGGDRVNIHVTVAPGQMPETYQPSDLEASRILKSTVFFRLGLPAERGPWFKAIERTGRPRVVDLRTGLELIEMPAHGHGGHGEGHGHGSHKEHDHGAHAHGAHDDHGAHDHGAHDDHGATDDHGAHDHAAHDDHGAHDHGAHAHAAHKHSTDHAGHDHSGPDPHVWLSPRQLSTMARTITDTLIEVDPAFESTYRKNLAALLDELKALDHDLQQLFAPWRGRTFFVFHPAWGYLAHDYGLQQVSIEMEGKDPSESELTALQRQARKEKLRVLFIEPQSTGRAARAVAVAVGARVEQIDPLAADVADNLRRVARSVGRPFGDVADNLRRVARQIVRSFEASDAVEDAPVP